MSVELKFFAVLFRYKTRSLYKKGRWKEKEVLLRASDLAEALRLAKKYGESNFRSAWVADFVHELSSGT